MRTWESFIKDVKEDNSNLVQDIEVMETLAKIVSAIIEKRDKLGYSQRDLAELCGLPQSSVARIEACTVKPKIETLLKIMKPLGLTLKVVSL